MSHFKVSEGNVNRTNQLLELISNQLYIANLVTKGQETGVTDKLRNQVIALEILIDAQRKELGFEEPSI